MKEELRKKNEELRIGIDRYLAGRQPLHPERLALPSEEELAEAEAEFDSIVARRHKPRRVRLWPWAAAAVAAAVVAVFLRMPSDSMPPSPPLGGEGEGTSLEAAAPSTGRPDEPDGANGANEPDRPDKADRPNGAYEPDRPNKAYRAYKPNKPHEAPASAEPRLTPHQEALAEAYLAEVALEVAFERQAQQEAVRAFNAYLTGEEQPAAVIAL